jgi:hypothetical protein
LSDSASVFTPEDGLSGGEWRFTMPPSSTQNRLLSSLAPENSQRLMASSQFVELPIRLTLHGSEQAMSIS